MATIFSPLLPPPGDNPLGHLTQGFFLLIWSSK